MQRLMFALLLNGLLVATAQASGGVWCTGEDDNIAFEFSAGSSRDGFGPWFGVQGFLTVKKADGLPAELAKFDLKPDHIVRSWADGEKILLDVEKTVESGTDYSRVRLIVETKAVDELEFEGTYALDAVPLLPPGKDQVDDIVLKGKMSCSAE